MSNVLTAFAGIGLLASVTASAQTNPPIQNTSLESAQRFLDASGQTSDSEFYAKLLTPVLVEALKSRRPDLSEDCWKTLGGLLQDGLISSERQAHEAIAATYASHFSVTELDQLSTFFSSDLGNKYRHSLAEIVSSGVHQPGAAKPFVDGMSKLLHDQNQTDADGRMVIVLKALKGRMSEEEVSRLATFFSNGVGKKYTELTPAITTEISGIEANLLTASLKPAMDQMHAQGTCL